MKLLRVFLYHFWPSVLLALSDGIAFAVAASGGIDGGEWACLGFIGGFIGVFVVMFQKWWLDDNGDRDEFDAALPLRVWVRERDGHIEVCRRGGGHYFEKRTFDPDAYEAAMDAKHEFLDRARTAAERRDEARKLARVLNR